MASRQPFTRLPVPQATPDVQTAVNDIYDKLAQVPQSTSGLSSQIAVLETKVAALSKDKAAGNSGVSIVTTGVPADTNPPAASIAGATGRAADPQLAFLPALLQLPSAVPNSTIYARDGVLIEVTKDTSKAGQIYRYSLDKLTWAGPFGGLNLVDTHGNRLALYPASGYSKGTTFTETDREAFYYNDGNGNWVLIVGFGSGLFYKQYADLTQYDAGYLWVATEFSETYQWNGAAWIPQLAASTSCVHTDRIAIGQATMTSGTTLTWFSGPKFAPEWAGRTMYFGSGEAITLVSWTDIDHMEFSGAFASGTHTYWMEMFSPVYFAQGSLLYETDRTVTYIALNNTTGAGDMAGTTLTWTAGPVFSPYWTGRSINVHGSPNTIVAVTSSTTITLGTAVVSLSGITWIADVNSWWYDGGLMIGGTSDRPGDLNPYTDVGFLFNDKQLTITYKGLLDSSSGTPIFYFAYLCGVYSAGYGTFLGLTVGVHDVGYTFAFTDYCHVVVYTPGVGWGFGPGDSGSGYIAASIGAPLGGYWAQCAGGTTLIMGIVSGNVELFGINLPDLSTGAFLRGGAYSGATPTAGSVPTWQGGASTNPIAQTTITYGGTGTSTAVDTGAAAGLSNANAKLNVPSDANGGLPDNMKLIWYMRR